MDPEEFLRELTSFNEEPKAAKPDPVPGPTGEQGRGRRRTEAAPVVASDGRRTIDQRRVKAGVAGASGAAGGAGAAATAGAAGAQATAAQTDDAPDGSTDARKSLIGLLVAAIATVLILSWIATSCLGEDDSLIDAGASAQTTEPTDSTQTTPSSSTTSTTTPPTTVGADLGGEAAAALAGAGIQGITATANGSTVVLTGSTPDEATKAAAQAAVEALAGVEIVDNQIVIAAARDINAEANAALASAGILGVTAVVEGDVATLTGQAANGEQRLAAELAMLNIAGIESVVNQITLPPTPAEILTGTVNDIVLANPIQFSTGSADIRSESQPILDQVAQVLAANPNGAVEVGGHTDSDGGADGNRELSQERAQSVVDYLVSKGVDPARLSAVGYGEDAPLVPNDSGDNKRKNRRIEFKVI